MLLIGAAADLLEGVLVEGEPTGGVGDLLRVRAGDPLGGEASRIVVPRPQQRCGEGPSRRAGIVGVEGAAKRRERGRALAQAVRRGAAVCPPPSLEGLFRPATGLLHLVGELAHLARELREALVIYLLLQAREVGPRLSGKRQRAARVGDAARGVCLDAAGRVRDDQQRERRLETLDTVRGRPREVAPRVEDPAARLSDLRPRGGEARDARHDEARAQDHDAREPHAEHARVDHLRHGREGRDSVLPGHGAGVRHALDLG